MHRTLKLNNLTNIVVSLAYICEALFFYGLEWSMFSTRSENLRLHYNLTTQIKCLQKFICCSGKTLILNVLDASKLIKWLKSFNATTCWAFYWCIKTLSISLNASTNSIFSQLLCFDMLCNIPKTSLLYFARPLWVACHKFVWPLRSCETDAATGQTTGQRHQCRFRIPQ